MKQADVGLNLTTKREFQAEMGHVVPWAALVGLITPYAPEGKRARPPFAVETMLRIHFMQQWFTLSVRPWKSRCTTCRCAASSRG